MTPHEERRPGVPGAALESTATTTASTISPADDFPGVAAAQYERLADLALTHGEIAVGHVGDGDVVAVPDVVLLEHAAHGQAVPPSTRARRADGREVAFFALPAVEVVAS